jgi:hypothetical protein
VRSSVIADQELVGTGRVEAFSDAVFAITITLLVLEIRRPPFDQPSLGDRLLDHWTDYVAFAVSFIYIGVVWSTITPSSRAFARSTSGSTGSTSGSSQPRCSYPFPPASSQERSVKGRPATVRRPWPSTRSSQH